MNTEIGPADYKGKKHIFQIVTPGRVYIMQGASDSDIDHWIKSLREAQNPKGKVAQPGAPPARVDAPDSDEEVRPLCLCPQRSRLDESRWRPLPLPSSPFSFVSLRSILVPV